MNTVQEAEVGLLKIIASASMVRPDNATKVFEQSTLSAEDFSSPALGQLWQTVGEFVSSGQAVDVLAIVERLKHSPEVRQAGGQRFIAETLMGVSPSRHIAPEYARIVSDASLRRRATTLVATLHKWIKSEARALQEVLADGAEAWAGLIKRNVALKAADGDILAWTQQAEEALKGGKEWCQPTGIQALDAEIGGLQASVLTMVGALPGVGKSALLATIVYNLARSGVKVGFFSLEDERLWLTRRFLSLVSGVPLFALTTFRLSEQQHNSVYDVSDALHRLLKNVLIDDRQGLTPSEVSASAKDMILNHGCKVIIVDHLGEMRLERSERYDLDVADALAQLRDIAKRYKMPVVVASHVRRRQGLTVDDAPHLTDFANSSAPERMARVALGLSKVKDEKGGGVRVSVLKQTNGPSGAELGLRLVNHAAMVSNDETMDAGVSK